VNRKHVLWLIGHGYVKAVKTSPRRWWVEEASVRERAAESEQWVSHVEAARIVGCSPQTILRAAKAGQIERRDVPRSLPSLSRTSAMLFAARS
jgi:hypothetical protein